jgi:hypothetical protein
VEKPGFAGFSKSLFQNQPGFETGSTIHHKVRRAFFGTTLHRRKYSWKDFKKLFFLFLSLRI